jgi:hypothetical protein
MQSINKCYTASALTNSPIVTVQEVTIGGTRVSGMFG